MSLASITPNMALKQAINKKSEEKECLIHFISTAYSVCEEFEHIRNALGERLRTSVLGISRHGTISDKGTFPNQGNVPD